MYLPVCFIKRESMFILCACDPQNGKVVSSLQKSWDLWQIIRDILLSKTSSSSVHTNFKMLVLFNGINTSVCSTACGSTESNYFFTSEMKKTPAFFQLFYGKFLRCQEVHSICLNTYEKMLHYNCVHSWVRANWHEHQQLITALF